MKLIKLLLMITVIATCNYTVNAQGSLEFIKIEQQQDYQKAWFSLDHQANEMELKDISNAFNNMAGIISFISKDGLSCVIKFKEDVMPEDIQAVLQMHSFDFDYNTINGGDVESADQENITYPEHYPVKQNTGNPEQDKKAFERALIDWKKAYPEEYKNFSVKNK